MKARGEEGRAGVGAGEGAAIAPPREREGPRPTQPVYQLHGRGLPPPGAMDREWAGLKGGGGASGIEGEWHWAAFGVGAGLMGDGLGAVGVREAVGPTLISV